MSQRSSTTPNDRLCSDARDIERQAVREANGQAQLIVVDAIQRVASEQLGVCGDRSPLPGDDMKGRIIGREGRNIRAFERSDR